MKAFILLLLSASLLLTTAAQQPSQDSIAKASVDSSELYGLIPQRPIKVGGGALGGVAKQREYLQSLRDARGKQVSFERIGSCCAYPSENGFDGFAMLDRYEVTHKDADNKKQKVIFYISFYDYEEPRAVKGFTLKN